jgi:hypothetical protein
MALYRDRDRADLQNFSVWICKPPKKLLLINGLVGDSSTVEQRTLTPLILVRIQVPQPIDITALSRLSPLEQLDHFGVHFGEFVPVSTSLPRFA